MRNFDFDLFCNRFNELIDGKSQLKLSEEMNLSQPVISKLKKHTGQAPSADTVFRIADYFNVSTDWLLGLTDVKSTDKATKELCDTLGLSENTIECLLDSTDIYAKKSIDWLVFQHLESISSNSNIIKTILSNSNQIAKEALKKTFENSNFLFENSILGNLSFLIDLENRFTDVQFVINDGSIDVNVFKDETVFLGKSNLDENIKLPNGSFYYKELMCTKYTNQINEEITKLVHSIKNKQEKSSNTAITNYMENIYNMDEAITNKYIKAEKNGNNN